MILKKRKHEWNIFNQQNWLSNMSQDKLLSPAERQKILFLWVLPGKQKIAFRDTQKKNVRETLTEGVGVSMKHGVINEG